MNNLLEKIRNIYNEYPRAFWTYNIIVFIDRLGGFMLYPFFALYLTHKFDIGMSTAVSCSRSSQSPASWERPGRPSPTAWDAKG